MPNETPQNGLSESAASGLAYFTFIPAIIFLVVAPYNASPTIRFHSWQSIFLFGVLVCYWVLSIVLVFIPFLGFLISLLIGVGLFVLWLVCIIKAFNGGRLVVPVIGQLAAKQAGV